MRTNFDLKNLLREEPRNACDIVSTAIGIVGGDLVLMKRKQGVRTRGPLQANELIVYNGQPQAELQSKHVIFPADAFITGYLHVKGVSKDE